MKKYFIFIVLSFISFLGIVNAENGPFKQFAYIEIYRDEELAYIYNPSDETDEYEGATYDKETNTLTINNINCDMIDVSAMGEDFKIKVIGNNTINRRIIVEGKDYKTNLEIIGNGSLVLGASNLWNEAISLTYGSLVIDDTVSLTIQNQSNSDKNLISVYNDSNVDKLITIKSNDSVEVISVTNVENTYHYFGAYIHEVNNYDDSYILKKGTKYYAATKVNGDFYNVFNRELKTLVYNEETIYYSDSFSTWDYTSFNISDDGYEIIKEHTPILVSTVITGVKRIDPLSNKLYYVDNEIYETTENKVYWNDEEYRYVILKNGINEENLVSVNNLKQSYIESHYLEINPSKYVILEGNNATYDSKNSLSFTINAPYSLFEDGGKVYVDDKEITDYTSKEGSTIITLNKIFLDTLEAGNHTIKVEFTNGAYATGEFTVNAKKNNPKTGDSLISIISILVISLLVLIINKRHLMI